MPRLPLPPDIESFSAARTRRSSHRFDRTGRRYCCHLVRVGWRAFVAGFRVRNRFVRRGGSFSRRPRSLRSTATAASSKRSSTRSCSTTASNRSSSPVARRVSASTPRCVTPSTVTICLLLSDCTGEPIGSDLARRGQPNEPEVLQHPPTSRQTLRVAHIGNANGA